MNEDFNDSIYHDEEFKSWYQKLKNKNPNREIMKRNNPVVIPRNYKVEEALEAAHHNNLDPLYQLLQVLEKPYEHNPTCTDYQKPSPLSSVPYKTFCGT